MSRGIRDLRELICVSRLTVRESDEDEEILSDEERQIHDQLHDLSIGSSRENTFLNREDTKSSDSGLGTNGTSPESDKTLSARAQQLQPHPPVSNLPAAARKKRRRKRKQLEVQTRRHDLPKTTPLPPVRTDSQLSGASGSSESSYSVDSSRVSSPSTNFDYMLIFVDSTIVSDWLQHCNAAVADLTEWCDKNDNFVHFSHFWLSDFPNDQRYDLFKLEHGIILDHLNLVFASGRDSNKIKHKDLLLFLEAVFHEYPAKLLSSKGCHLFLDHLDVLSSERQSSYKKLLSDVKLSTRNKQYAQWCLAVRAFALVSVWTSVVNFFRRLSSDNRASRGLPLPALAKRHADIYMDRTCQAIRHGYVDVLNYCIRTGKVKSDAKDSHGKTFVFNAVMHRQIKVLQYLLTQVKPCIDVNHAADTGNTALHAAANNGDVNLVSALLHCDTINVNPVNKQCDDATPLHLAVLHGHKEVVEVLLQAKADTEAKMGDLTAADIARDFGHDHILTLFTK